MAHGNRTTAAEETQDETKAVEGQTDTDQAEKATDVEVEGTRSGEEEGVEGRFEAGASDETIVDERSTEGAGDGYPKSMDDYKGGKSNYQTTGDFQLYDASTRTLFPMGESVEAADASQFVQRQVRLGRLKKV